MRPASRCYVVVAADAITHYREHWPKHIVLTARVISYNRISDLYDVFFMAKGLPSRQRVAAARVFVSEEDAEKERQTYERDATAGCHAQHLPLTSITPRPRVNPLTRYREKRLYQSKQAAAQFRNRQRRNGARQ